MCVSLCMYMSLSVCVSQLVSHSICVSMSVCMSLCITLSVISVIMLTGPWEKMAKFENRCKTRFVEREEEDRSSFTALR